MFVYCQRDGMARFQKEEEEKTLKAITLFCFPEGINWAPLTEYHRYSCCSFLYSWFSTLYISVHALFWVFFVCFQWNLLLCSDWDRWQQKKWILQEVTGQCADWRCVLIQSPFPKLHFKSFFFYPQICSLEGKELDHQRLTVSSAHWLVSASSPRWDNWTFHVT